MKNPRWSVIDVKAQKDYTLVIKFFSGETKIYDARPLLQKEIYSSLNNLAFFMSARACCGTVVWDDDIDIAPEHLYECSQPYSSFAS